MPIPGLQIMKQSIFSLLDHPLRSLLTSLGIIIGVAAVYSMLAIGEGSRREILDNLNSVSARTMSVFPDWSRRGRASARRPWRPFSEDTIDQIRGISGVMAATGSMNRDVTVVNEQSDWSADMQGVDLDYIVAKDIKITEGTAITAADLERRETVAVIGQTVKRTLFRGQNPIGARIKINNIPFTIKGVAGKVEGDNWRGQDQDNFLMVPRTTARNRIMGGNKFVRDWVSGISIVAHDQKDMTRIEREVSDVLKRVRGLKPNDTPDYRVFNFSANRQANAQTQRTLSILLAAMGAISLIVGGVGVMNIMLVSVTERTREIGLRMALGARKGDILSQFLTEALLLSLFGGIVGLAIGYGASNIVTKYQDLNMVFSWAVAGLAAGSALLIGVLFGFLPARSAAKLNPIEALRHE